MTRSACLVVALLASAVWAQDAEKGDGAAPAVPPGATRDEQTVERSRSPIEALAEKFIGSSSRAVRFDWRARTVGFGLLTSGLFELNSFASARVGGFARFPMGDFLVELAVSRVIVWGSESTGRLAQTPYRQTGRPNRFEVDLNFDYVLAEGVVTPRPSFLPPVQMVFSATAGVRYVLYTEIFQKNLKVEEVVGALFLPRMTQKEIDNLEAVRLPAMDIDRVRYSVLVGLSLDIYFKPGLFFSPRVLLALPIFATPERVGLGAWWELGARFGYMW
jgi:hypothetical protein